MFESYRFDRVELQPDARRLLVDGAERHLGGRAFDMLLALVERRGRVVSKDELLDLVWPGLVVEENNLQAQVSALRKVIGPRPISTIPGRGYRFDAAVQCVDSAAAAAAAGRVIAPAPPLPLAPVAAAPIGRDDALATLAALSADHALVTLVGAGGIGKTRLAQAFAERHRERFAGGIVWIDLAVVSDSSQVPAALAAALGVTLVPRVDAFEMLVAALRDRPLLVLIDNAEHLADAVARAVVRLLAAGPLLRLVVTSQQPLRVGAEQVCRVAPLDVPTWPCSADQAARSGAVALFVQRARAADRRFVLDEANREQVVRICRRLDGMPLALELAAVRVPLLGTAGLLSHLDARFDLLTGGDRAAPTRQQTLRAALDWSHDLLDAHERELLRRVAVFVGGFDLESAKAVLADDAAQPWAMLDGLGSLVDRSFVDAGGDTAVRYSMAETTRSYALDRLRESGELEAMRRRHAAATVALFERAHEDFWSMGDDDYVRRYAPELDNFRAAMDWSRDRECEWYVAMTAAAVPLLRHLSLIREGLEYLALAERLVDASMPLARRARLALSASMLGGGRPMVERAMGLHRELGEERGLCMCAYWLATRNDVSAEIVAEMVALKRRLEDPRWPSKVLSMGGAIEEELLYRERRFDLALVRLDRRIAMCEAAGAVDAATSALMYRVVALFGLGDVPAAIAQSLSVGERCRRLGNHYRLACCQAYAFSAMLLVEDDRHAEADALARSFSTLDRTLGWAHCCDAADGWALLAARAGRLDAAASLLGFADALHADIGVARDGLADAARADAARRVDAVMDAARRDALAHDGASLTPEAAARLALPGWTA